MATNFATASYQEILDISTVPGEVGIIGIHTPCTMKPVGMLEGFYRQFSKVKYLGCDVKVQPAATLPADPLGVSYEAGDTTTDPRDLLNPIMIKGAMGDTLNTALDGIYAGQGTIGDSFDYVQGLFDNEDPDRAAGRAEHMYYAALSDPSFRKCSVLQPFSIRNLRPLVHNLVSNLPIYGDQSAWAAFTDMSIGRDTSDPTASSDVEWNARGDAGPNQRVWVGGSNSSSSLVNPSLFTTKTLNLSWMDTISRPQGVADDTPVTATGYKFNAIPKLFMSCVIMPPCYKSILTFRFVINHRFAFKDFMTSKYVGTSSGDTPNEAYTMQLAEIATASTASVDTINSEASTLTEGVF